MRKAVAVQPSLREAHLELGELYLEEQDYLRAIVAYRKLVELDPQDADAHFQLGVALQSRERNREALKSYQQARELYQQQNNQEGVQKAEAAIDEIE
ncbi:MAG: tetratricopeptide repeat protein [Leptolyngbya sp. IPPAS B-1204]